LKTVRSPFDAQSPQKPELAKAFLDEEHCPGARGPTDAEKKNSKQSATALRRLRQSSDKFSFNRT